MLGANNATGEEADKSSGSLVAGKICREPSQSNDECHDNRLLRSSKKDGPLPSDLVSSFLSEFGDRSLAVIS